MCTRTALCVSVTLESRDTASEGKGYEEEGGQKTKELGQSTNTSEMGSSRDITLPCKTDTGAVEKVQPDNTNALPLVPNRIYSRSC